MKAYGAWVILEPIPVDCISPGGLYIPDGSMQERLGVRTAKVLSVGPGRLSKSGNRVNFGIKEGDTVLTRGFLQEIWRPDGSTGKTCIIHIDDILAIVEE